MEEILLLLENNIVSGTLAGVIAGVFLILIQIHLDKRKVQREQIKGKRKKGILDENFLIHHLPRKITLNILTEYFGGPNDIEDLFESEKIYKYEFDNGILKILVDSNGQSISCLAFWYSGNYPVKCPNYSLNSQKMFGSATFTKKLIEMGEEYWTFDRPKLGYSSITCRFDFVELSYIDFTYYLLEATQSKEDLLYQVISQVSISYSRSKSNIFIHYEDIEQYFHNYG